MRMVAIATLIVAALSLLLAPPLRGQVIPNLEVGLKTYGSYDGGNIDSVNLETENLYIRFPLFSYPQRGRIFFGLSLVHNSKNFSVSTYCDPTTGDCNSAWYWVGGQGAEAKWDTGDYGFNLSSTQYLGANWYSAKTSDGSTHVMAPLHNQTSGTWESTDGTGLYYNPTGPVVLLPEYESNGNKLSLDGSGHWVDTIGRTTGGASLDATGCTGPLTVQSVTTFSAPGPGGTTRYIKDCFVVISLNTNFQANDSSGLPIAEMTPPVSGVTLSQSIVIYNGVSWATSPAWTFQYDPNYGDLTQITFPMGGTISYTWFNMSSFCGGGYVPMSRGVATRTVDAHDGSGQHTTTYQPIVDGPPPPSIPATLVTDALGNDVVHDFTGLGGTCSFYETQTRSYQGSHSTGVLLKTVTTDYSWLKNPNDVVYPSAPISAINVHPIRVTTTWANGMVSKIENDYDANLSIHGNSPSGTYPISYGNVTEKREYDYGSGSPGPLLRRTDYTYLPFTNSQYLNANLLRLVSSAIVYDGNGQQISKTIYGYDEYPLTASGVTTNHDTTLPNPGNRGNRTSVCRWLNTTGTNLCTVTKDYDTGVPYQVIDPLGFTTTFSYSSAYAGAYVTQTQLPDTGSPVVHHTMRGTYDFNSGLLTTYTDQNNQSSTYAYDILGRVKTASFPDQGQTNFSYNDTALPVSVTRTRSITASMNTANTTLFDGLGRVQQFQLTSDPQGTVYTDTTYDALGRTATVSNPYRSTSDSTYGLTTYNYDPLGRTTKVIPPDGSASSNNVSTSYSGNTTTVVDQTGKSRKSVTDGLGRLTQVFEDPTGLNYETDYQYDALDNLTRVDQKGGSTNSANWRTRTFTYNSLSQLITAANPESGAVTYAYDANGNLLQKTSPAPNQTGSATVTLSYCYEVLNRLTAKGYTFSPNTPPTCTNGTIPSPVATYSYDQTNCLGQPSCFNVGRRTGMTDSAGSELWAYDSMGRPLADQRTTNGAMKPTTYTYNLDGSVATLTYPSGRAITYTLASSNGNTAGRISSAVDSIGPINYATAATYTPPGSLASLTNGASTVSTLFYNNRLQPCRISVKNTGTAPASCTDTATGNVLDFSYNFSLGSSDNGNVTAITNNRDTNRSQMFSYDSLNRIAVAETTSTHATSPSNCWGEAYFYDNLTTAGGGWGNLTTITSPSSAYTGCTGETLSISVLSNNQISGFCYDAAGNLLAQSAPPCPVPTYTYNAENQLTATAGVTYTYDGDGKRVQKSSGKLYWYGMGSDPLDETDLSGNLSNEYIFFNGKRIARRDYQNNVNYYFADHLGTARIVADSSGTPVDDSDFYPFGGERPITSSSGNTYKFTGKERDSESGLDNFGARYDSSSMGRFMSPDPLLNSGQPWNPQSWNRYAYTENNPLRYTDPTGMWKWGKCSGTVDECEDKAERFRDSIKKAQEALKGLDPNSKEAKELKKTLDKIGEEGKGNIKVSFGALGQDKNGNLILGETNRSSITIDYGNIDKAQSSYGLNASESDALDAAVATHEGTHAFGPGLFGFRQGHLDEHTPYYIQSVTYQGLHNTDRTSLHLWNESWAAIDKPLLEQNREQAVQRASHPDKKEPQ